MNTTEFNWNGMHIHYREQGSGSVVLLLHGYGESAFIWDGLIEALKPNYRVVSLDLPGFGESPEHDSIGSLAELAEMALALMDELKIDEFVVAGHSMGGYIALELLAASKERLLGLGLVNSHIFGDDPSKLDLRLRSIKLMQNAGSDRFVEEMYNGLFTAAYKRDNSDEFEQLLHKAKMIPTSVLIQYYRLMMERAARMIEFSAFQKPVFVLCGVEDPLIPKEMALRQAYISQLTHFQWVEGCAHMAVFENPRVLQTVFSRYLTAVFAN